VKNKENEMGGACGMSGREKMYIQGFGAKTWEKRDHKKHVRVNGSTILKRLLKKSVGG